MKKKDSLDTKMMNKLFTRGVAGVIGKEGLEAKLKSGKNIRVKLGIDPTSPNIHLGRAAVLLKLRDFQKLGHKIVFIIGDFTGVIGDTSDKESERPMLTPPEVKNNMKTYIAQAAKIIDVKKAEIKKNSTWLQKLRYADIGKQADAFSVADFIARDNIRRRLTKGMRVSLRELLYPLMQGYDSVMVRADLEIGGTDQLFNMLAGRTMQEKEGHSPQAVMTLDILSGTDGRKMSSSWENTINVTDEPADMYGKVMSLPDDSIVPYLTSLTRIPADEIDKIKQGLMTSAVHPRDAKMRLAREITTLCHGEKKAREAEGTFVKTFQKKEIPEAMQEYKMTTGETFGNIFVASGCASSMSAAQRLADGNAVKNLGTKEIVTDMRSPAKKGVFKIGKRQFLKII